MRGPGKQPRAGFEECAPSENLPSVHRRRRPGGGQPYRDSHPRNNFWRFFREKLIGIAELIPFTILAYRPTPACPGACPLSFESMKTTTLIMPFGLKRIMPPAFSQDRQFPNTLAYQD